MKNNKNISHIFYITFILCLYILFHNLNILSMINKNSKQIEMNVIYSILNFICTKTVLKISAIILKQKK